MSSITLEISYNIIKNEYKKNYRPFWDFVVFRSK